MLESVNCARAAFLERTGLTLAAALATESIPAAARAAGGSGPPMAAASPAEALSLLKAGNARWVAGTPEGGPMTTHNAELANGQSPFAIVLGCSDSRVPVATVFDQPAGNIFVVRVAGNFVTIDGLGSIEYSIAVLKSKLIVVLGHSKCGAVDAAVGYVKDGTTQPGHIQSLVTAIAPAAKVARTAGGDWLANAIAENVRMNVAAMTARSTIVADAVKEGKVRVVGGVYDLHYGSVAFLKA